MKPVQVYDGDGRRRIYDGLSRELHVYLLNSHVQVWEANFVTKLYIGDNKEVVTLIGPHPETMKKIDKLIDILQTLREHDVEERPIFHQMTFLAQGQENYRHRQVLSLDYQIDYADEVDEDAKLTGDVLKTTTVKLVWKIL